MRSLWLASTALLITTGIACAQSTPMASPAPTGAVTAPQVAPSGTPGNMAPAPTSDSMSTTSTPSATGASSPAPNGAASAPDVNAGAAPGTSPGKMAPTTGSTTTTSESGAATPMHHHSHKPFPASLPENASAASYLHIAKTAIWHHNVTLADDALSHAETQLLDRSVPQGQIAPDSSAPVTSIESARKALAAGDFTKALADTKQAASAVSST